MTRRMRPRLAAIVSIAAAIACGQRSRESTTEALRGTSSTAGSGPAFSTTQQHASQVGWNGYYFSPTDHRFEFPPPGDARSEQAYGAWVIEMKDSPTDEDVEYFQSLGLAYCSKVGNVFFEHLPLAVARKVSRHERVNAVMHLWPTLKLGPGVDEDTAYLGEPFLALAFGNADVEALRTSLSATPGLSAVRISRDPQTFCPDVSITVQASSFAAVAGLSERPELRYFELYKKPEPHGTRGPGESCDIASDCQSGVCEGQGCGPGQGVCARMRVVCTADGAPFCGCDGQTFNASSSCPRSRFAHKGACM